MTEENRFSSAYEGDNIEAEKPEVMPEVVESKKAKSMLKKEAKDQKMEAAKEKKKLQIRKTKLCKLIKTEFQKKHMDEYIELVETPAWVCKKCGRTAKEMKSLCKPIPLMAEEVEQSEL